MKNLSYIGQELKALGTLLLICQVNQFAQRIGRLYRTHTDFAENGSRAGLLSR